MNEPWRKPCAAVLLHNMMKIYGTYLNDMVRLFGWVPTRVVNLVTTTYLTGTEDA